MDLGTIGGLIFATVCIIYFGVGFTNIPMFYDLPSVGITVFGTIGGILVSFPLKTLANLGTVCKQVFFPQTQDPIAVIKQIVDFAEQARREGILCLEARSQEVEDEFLKKGIQLAVDGTEPELIKDILQTEISFIEDRHAKNTEVMTAFAALAPAFGMIGTLVGLVLMLANMSDPDSIGPAMAVALITTLYGAIIANLFAAPFESKLKIYSAQEILLKTLMLEGIMSLQSGDNPKIVQWKLEAFVDPAVRLKLKGK